MTVAKESCHYYDKFGNPAYTQPNKSKGGVRPTTIRDCRLLSLVPSVTTILSIVDKPGLNRWKRDQILMSALTLPKIEGESLDDFSKRVVEDSGKQAELARKDGTDIHGALEKFYLTGYRDEKYRDMIASVEQSVADHFGEQDWSAEKSFANMGFGGKVDLHNSNTVIDFKTTAFTESNKPRGWPEQVQQLSAYAKGLSLQEGFRCANVYISTSVNGLVHVKEWSKEEIEKGWRQFYATFKLWCELKNYYPGAE